MIRTVCSVVGAAALFLGMPAAADPAINLITPGLQYPGTQYTLGFEFSVATAQSIDALGVYDSGGDGLGAPATIGLWNTTGTLLASTSIATGGGTLNGLFRYASIAPYALTPGAHYIVGAYTTDLASSEGTGQGGSATINPFVTVYQDRYSNFNSMFSFPDTTSGSVGGAWLGGNFNLAAPVPEPTTWAMMLVGFGAVGFAMRRRLRVATSVSLA